MSHWQILKIHSHQWKSIDNKPNNKISWGRESATRWAIKEFAKGSKREIYDNSHQYRRILIFMNNPALCNGILPLSIKCESQQMRNFQLCDESTMGNGAEIWREYFYVIYLDILGSSFKKILNWGKYFLRIADEIWKVKGYE